MSDSIRSTVFIIFLTQTCTHTAVCLFSQSFSLFFHYVKTTFIKHSSELSFITHRPYKLLASITQILCYDELCNDILKKSLNFSEKAERVTVKGNSHCYHQDLHLLMKLHTKELNGYEHLIFHAKAI